jgi:hypothetical protein
MKRDYLKRKAFEELQPTEAAKTERVMVSLAILLNIHSAMSYKL